ncbi:MAG: hypothetical protein AB7O49_03495 [Sphingomonadales bacterium]
MAALLSTPALAEALPKVPDSELAVGGIRTGDSEASVVRRLGEPVRKAETDEIRLEYAGLTIWLDERVGVTDIKSIDPKYCTPSKVCVGMALAQVRSVYGEVMIVQRGDGKVVEYIPSSGDPCWLQLALSGDSVTSVAVRCQP